MVGCVGPFVVGGPVLLGGLEGVPSFPVPKVRFGSIAALFGDTRYVRVVLGRVCRVCGSGNVAGIMNVRSENFILNTTLTMGLNTNFVVYQGPNGLPTRAVGRDCVGRCNGSAVRVRGSTVARRSMILVRSSLLTANNSVGTTCGLMGGFGPRGICVGFVVRLAVRKLGNETIFSRSARVDALVYVWGRAKRCAALSHFWFVPPAVVAARRERGLSTCLGNVMAGLPSDPKYCRCLGRRNVVVCMNGTGGLGQHICSCFDGRRRDHGATVLMDGVESVGCVIIGARRSTLLLRGGLVGHCGPRCGMLLGSSGACPSVYMAGRCFPHVFGAERVAQGNSACFNPCDRRPALATLLRLVGGLCPLQAYRLTLAPRGVHGNGFGMYLRCRVGGYGNPYVKTRGRRRCLRTVGRTGRVLGKGATRVDQGLVRRVGILTSRVHFRRTRLLGEGCSLLRGCHDGDRMMDGILRGVSIFTVRSSRRTTCVGCLRMAGKDVGRTFAFRCGGHVGRSRRRLLKLNVTRVHRQCGDGSGRVVIPFPLRLRVRKMAFAAPREKSGGGLLRLSALGIGRCGTSHVGRTRGLGPRRGDIQLVGRLRRLLRLRGLPVRVRYFSGSGVSKASTITTYMIFGGYGPDGRSCHGCGVGAMMNPSSCTSVGRIIHHHCSQLVRRRGRLPSLVVASNKGKRVRMIERIVRSRLGLHVPVTKLTGSGQRHAGRLLFKGPPLIVKLGARDPIFHLLARVRSRMRHFTVAFRHSGHDGRRASSTLSRVGNVKRGAGARLLGGFGDMGQVHRTACRRLTGRVNTSGTGLVRRGLARGT